MQPTFLRTFSQLARHLHEEILRQTWVGQLPGERHLAERYQVARKTVRAALSELRHQGVIVTRHGAGSVIQSARTMRRGAVTKLEMIGILLPRPLIELRQHTALWVSKLADLLQRTGYHLEIFSGARYYSATAGRSLERLTCKHPAACWLLAASTRYQQQWFSSKKLPAVIAGSLHPGVSLPSVDIDHRALCRHAAGLFMRAGHRRIALLYPRTGRAGDAESEEGFREGCRQTAGVAPLIYQHGETTRSVYHLIATVMKCANPPTGLLLANSHNYLTLASCLLSLGRNVPGDVSVIARDDDAFMRYMLPAPDCYHISPDIFARRLRQAVLATISGGSATRLTVRLMPEYRRGGSLRSVR